MSPTDAFDSLADWLRWLESLSPREIDLGLGRVLEVTSRLGLDLPERIVHVAGTNGKGSTVAMLERLLALDGSTIGCYTSPHVFDFNERIRVGGIDATDSEIVEAFRAVEGIRQGVPLTYFEYATVAALRHFSERRCDALVLEVGMGGRLDAVNAVEPAAGIITNIALDHCDWLGGDLESIAREKAGIMRAGKPVIFGSVDRPQAIDAAAHALGASLFCAGRDFTVTKYGNGRWSWESRSGRIDDLDPPPLPGAFQIDNAAGVLALAEVLGCDEGLDAKTINEALAGLNLSGRFERVRGKRDWILDVAHNPHAARALANGLADAGIAGSVVAIIGALDDKDLEGIVEPLVPYVDQWIAVTADSPRGISASNLARRVAATAGKPCLIMPGLGDAMSQASAMSGTEDAILVTGSFYVVGPALEWIRATSG